uniref:Ig-like domain-containing protein n=1 Tax=Lates calcarifer TaxID=8187 RepID=A0A4W6C6B7_LATCA
MDAPSKRVISTGLSVASALPLWSLWPRPRRTVVNTPQYPPAFVTRPDPQTVYVGKRAVIQCVITGSAPVNVVWLKDNQVLPKVPTHYQTSCEKNKHTLEITKLEVADRGLYVCKVSNNVGTAECSMELRVIDKPNFVNHHSLEAKQHCTAAVHCQRIPRTSHHLVL